MYRACSFVINFGIGKENKFNSDELACIGVNKASTFIRKLARFSDPSVCKKFEL
jgi:hypothetical protein